MGLASFLHSICMSGRKSKNRHKYLLQYHLIFVCKYRKPLLENKEISDDIKRLSTEISKTHNISIRYMETDKNHIHYMIETSPNVNLSNFIRMLKSYTSYLIWKLHKKNLSKYIYCKQSFWAGGYFICSVGDVSAKILKEYIENQG